MVSIQFDPKEFRKLKITQREVNDFLSAGFKRMMTNLLAYSKIHHDWNKQTGKTSASMRKKINRNGREGRIYSHSDVAKFLYYGTTKHWVEPTRKKALSWVELGGERRFSKGHFVSGIKPEPWIEDNFEMKEKRFLAMVEKSLTDGLVKKWS